MYLCFAINHYTCWLGTTITWALEICQVLTSRHGTIHERSALECSILLHVTRHYRVNSAAIQQKTTFLNSAVWTTNTQHPDPDLSWIWVKHEMIKMLRWSHNPHNISIISILTHRCSRLAVFRDNRNTYWSNWFWFIYLAKTALYLIGISEISSKHATNNTFKKMNTQFETFERRIRTLKWRPVFFSLGLTSSTMWSGRPNIL